MLGCGSSRASLSTRDEVQRVAFEKGLLLLRESGRKGPHPVCVATRFTRARGGYEVEDPSAELVNVLRASHPLIRSGSDCTFTKYEAVRGAFGLPGALMWVDGVSPVGNRAIARIGYYVEPMYSAEFECDLQLRNGEWRATRCILVMVS